MTPEFRSDLAYRRAQGWSWKELGGTLSCDPDALRRATENDPQFAEAQERAWAAVTWEGQADGMRRLRHVATGGEGASATQAAEVLVRYAQERRRDETRLAVEHLRAQTRLEVEKLRNERAAAKKTNEEAEPRAPGMLIAPDPTPEEWERINTEEAAQPGAEVYLWGGRHRLCVCEQPDAADVRVRIKKDWSLGVAGGRDVVYWIVADGDTDNLLALKPVFGPGLSA